MTTKQIFKSLTDSAGTIANFLVDFNKIIKNDKMSLEEVARFADISRARLKSLQKTRWNNASLWELLPVLVEYGYKVTIKIEPIIEKEGDL